MILTLDSRSHRTRETAVASASRVLAPGEVLVVQNVQTEWIPALQAAGPPGGYAHAVDLRNLTERYDDILFVVARRPTVRHL
jgi:hypothetical protein